MMAPFIKKIILALLCIMVLAVIAILTAKHYLAPYIQPDAIKARIVAQIESRSALKVNIPTPLRLHWWPRPALSGSNITIVNPNNPKQHHIKLPKASLSIAILPLLYGKVAINHISLSNPEIALNDTIFRTIKYPQTKTTQGTPEKPASQPEKTTGKPISPDHISIKNGTLKYYKQGQLHQLTLSQLEMVEQGYHNYHIKMAANYHSEALDITQIKLNTQARWIIKQSRLMIKKLQFSSTVHPKKTNQTYPVSLSATQLEYQRANKAFHIQRGKFSLPHMQIKANLQTQQHGNKKSLDGTTELRIDNVKQWLTSLGQPKNTAPDSKLIANIQLDTQSNRKQNNTYKLTLGKEQIQVKRIIQNPYTQPTIQTTTHITGLTPKNWLNTIASTKAAYQSIRTILPLPSPKKNTNKASEKTTQPTNSNTSKPPTETHQLSIDAIHFGRIALNKIQGTIRTQNHITQSDDLHAMLHQSPIKLQFKLQNTSTDRQASLTLKGNQIDLSKLIESLRLKNDFKMKSMLSFSSKLSTHGKTTDLMKKQLQGYTIIQFGPGHFSSSLMQGALSNLEHKILTSLDHDQLITAASKPILKKYDHVKFTSLIAGIETNKGIASLNNMVMKSPMFNVTSSGTYHLPNNQLNAKIYIRVVPGFNEFLYHIQQKLHGNHLTILLKGPIQKPIIKPDSAGMINQLIKQKVQSKLLEIISNTLSTNP